MDGKTDGKTERAWQELFEEYDIGERVRREGVFRISAAQIKRVREPRLMAKFDHRKNLPDVFRKQKLGILPVTRGEYVIGGFELFERLPIPGTGVLHETASLPAWLESVSADTIASEPVALNCAWASGVLQRFLGEERLCPTLSGRMGARPFAFRIGGSGGTTEIAVDGAQIEVDGAFEGDGCVAIFEAKMDLAEDFIVRQLYYPFRHFSALGLSKRIRTVFMTYSGGVFDLAEYGFCEPERYDSLQLLRRMRYALAPAGLSKDDLWRKLEATEARPEPEGVPFPQADSFARVVNLCERLSAGPMGKEDIEEAYGFAPRQADYYANAVKYLGLAGKEAGQVALTADGRRFAQMGVSRRNVFLVERILRHEAFRRALRMALERGEVPGREELRAILLETNPGLGRADGNTYGRRASTVRHWIRWIWDLTAAKAAGACPPWN